MRKPCCTWLQKGARSEHVAGWPLSKICCEDRTLSSQNSCEEHAPQVNGHVDATLQLTAKLPQYGWSALQVAGCPNKANGVVLASLQTLGGTRRGSAMRGPQSVQSVP